MATLKISGKTYTLPALNTGQIRRHAVPLLERIYGMDAGGGLAGVGDVIGAHVDLLHMALKNQYPHLDLEEVETLTFPELQAAVLDLLMVSGLRGPAEGEVTPQKVAKKSR